MAEDGEMRGAGIKRGNRWAWSSTSERIRRRASASGSGTPASARSDAERARVALLSAVDSGTYIDPSDVTLADYLRDDWLPSRRPTAQRAGRRHRGKVSPNTWSTYHRDIEAYVISRLETSRSRR